MSYAIIETGGKQLRVEPGRFYDIELLHVDPEEQVTIENVLLLQHDGEVTIGQPFIAGATVEGTVMRHYRGHKVLVYKMKPKKKTRKKRGHRQEITRLMVNSISMNGSVLVDANIESQETPTVEAEVSALVDANTESQETRTVEAEVSVLVDANTESEETPTVETEVSVPDTETASE